MPNKNTSPSGFVKAAYIATLIFRIASTLFAWWLIYFVMAKLVHPIAGWISVAVVIGFTVFMMVWFRRLRRTRQTEQAQNESAPSETQ